MTYHVYILRSQTSGQFYIGQTQDLQQRISKHNSGYVKSTKGKGPWLVYFTIEVATRSEAMKIERKIKNLKSRKKIEEWLDKNYR